MNRIKKLSELIFQHKINYYKGTPEISDAEFDKLEDELRVLDPKNKILFAVGAEVTDLAKIKHEKKMLSLEKTYSLEDLIKWKGEEDILSTFKLDGMSCSLIYENSKISLAKTRGDGTYGEDITSKMRWMQTIPSDIKYQKKVEVRGEIYCDEEDFFELCKEMENLKLAVPTNPRNIVAGLMGRKENIDLSRYLKFMAFDILFDEVNTLINYENEKLDFLKSLNFTVPDYVVHSNVDTINESIKNSEEFLTEGNYQIDGIVFTYNKLLIHEELGETSHHPRYKMAFKFKGDSKVTTLKEINWSVSRNGILTPVGEVVPVELSGAMISRVTLHNYGIVLQNNLKKNDEIEIIRSGEVIPKFLNVFKSSDSIFEIPTICPSCGEKVEIRTIRIFCINKKCPEKNRESILNFIQKIGIDDLSGKRLEEFINLKIVSNIKDLYLLTPEDLLKVDKVKEKLSTKLVDSIQKSKNCNLTVFLSALGIQGGAIGKCEKIVRAGFNTIDKILCLTKEDLLKVDSFAEKSSEDFYNSLAEKKELIRELIEIGFTFTVEFTRESLVSQKKICITGALSEKRSVIEEKIKIASGIVVSSVTKNTDILVTNEKDGNSSKFLKAKELKIKIITENELMELIN